MIVIVTIVTLTGIGALIKFFENRRIKKAMIV